MDPKATADREDLIAAIKSLLKTHEEKKKKFQEENGLAPDCSCITRELVEIASLLPEMQRLGVKFDDCR